MRPPSNNCQQVATTKRTEWPESRTCRVTRTMQPLDQQRLRRKLTLKSPIGTKLQTVANAIGNNALMLGQVQGIFHEDIDNTWPSQTLRVFANQMNRRVRIRGSKNWLVIKTSQVIMVPTNARRKRQMAIPQLIVDTNNWFNNQRMSNGTNHRKIHSNQFSK